MSSFSNPHFMYLFALKSKPGKRRLAYGQSPEDALTTLSFRCTPEEMDDIIRDEAEFDRICRYIRDNPRRWESI